MSFIRSILSLPVFAIALFGAVPARAEGYPTLIVSPAWSFRLPFQIVGLGAQTNVFIPHIVNVTATYNYGLNYHDDDDRSGSHWFEAYAGYPISWSGAAAADIADDSVTGGGKTTITYHQERRSTRAFLAIEGGVMSGSLLFQLQGIDPTTGQLRRRDASPFQRAQLIYPAAGVRYSRAFVGDDRASTTFWVHALGPVVGIPDAPSSGNIYAAGADDRHTTRSLGVKGGVVWTLFANSLATMLIEVAYLPAGGPAYVGFGNTFPFWF